MTNRLVVIAELRQSLADENISYGELALIDQMADDAGITVTEEMMASDVLDVLEERAEERRARILAGQLASFETGLRYHFANGPETWHVVKRAERSWHVVNGAGDTVEYATSKRDATERLNTGSYRHIWRSKDEWYRGTSRDPRNSQFTDAEQSIIVRVLGEL